MRALAVFCLVCAFSSHLVAQDANPSGVINLRCEGTARTSREGYQPWPEQTERISIGVTIDMSTGIGTISGLLFLSQIAAGDGTRFVFEVKERTFYWSKEATINSQRYMSRIEIDRYSATMEADDISAGYEAGKSFIWGKSVKASCKRYAEKAF